MRINPASSQLRVAALLLAIFAVGLSSCSKKKTELSTRNQAVWWLISDPDKLLPYISADEDAVYVQAEVFESLLNQNPETLEFIPWLASLPEASADHLTFTYTMNPLAKWSDGKPVTSADVIFSFKTVLNPVMIGNKPLRGYFIYLDSAYNPGGDMSKVAFHVSETRYDEDKIIGNYVKILPKHILDPDNLTDKMSWAELHNEASTDPIIHQFATLVESPERARDPKFQIGSGPYIYRSWTTNDRIIVTRNHDYWGQNMQWGEAYVDTIIYKTINDQNAALTSLKGRDIDIISQLKAPQYLTDIDSTKQPFLRKAMVYQNLYTYVGWNNRKPWFRDKMVRKALTMLIDRDQILHSIIKDLARMEEGPIAPTQPNWDSTVKQPGYNPDSAKKLLTAAGWVDSDGDGILDKVVDGKKTPFKFTFMVNAGNEVRKQVLLVIAEELKKVGIDAGVSAIEASIEQERLRTHNFDAVYAAWIGNPSEDAIEQLWSTVQINGGSNYCCYSNPEADKLFEGILNEFDQKKRYDMHYKLQHIMVEDQPVTWLFNSATLLGWVDRFDNLEFWSTRPPFDPRYWIVRGVDVKRTANGVHMSLERVGLKQ